MTTTVPRRFVLKLKAVTKYCDVHVEDNVAVFHFWEVTPGGTIRADHTSRHKKDTHLTALRRVAASLAGTLKKWTQIAGPTSDLIPVGSLLLPADQSSPALRRFELARKTSKRVVEIHVKGATCHVIETAMKGGGFFRTPTAFAEATPKAACAKMVWYVSAKLKGFTQVEGPRIEPAATATPLGSIFSVRSFRDVVASLSARFSDTKLATLKPKKSLLLVREVHALGSLRGFPEQRKPQPLVLLLGDGFASYSAGITHLDDPGKLFRALNVANFGVWNVAGKGRWCGKRDLYAMFTLDFPEIPTTTFAVWRVTEGYAFAFWEDRSVVETLVGTGWNQAGSKACRVFVGE